MLKCQADGNWNGTEPECKGNFQITCSMERLIHCISHLDIHVVLKRVILSLVQNLPSISASSCGDPGIPKNGAKDGSVYYYPKNVTYSCYTGYTLKGQKSISCQSNGQWSSPKPTCEGISIKTLLKFPAKSIFQVT